MNSIAIAGNVTKDPELRFSSKGNAVATFSIGVSRRIKKGDHWEDELSGFFRCSCFGDLAEHVAESLVKGTRVMVAGRLQQTSWEDQGGAKRTAIEIVADEVGPSLKWATATVTKTRKENAA